jgi:hypothetical protein
MSSSSKVLKVWPNLALRDAGVLISTLCLAWVKKGGESGCKGPAGSGVHEPVTCFSLMMGFLRDIHLDFSFLSSL